MRHFFRKLGLAFAMSIAAGIPTQMVWAQNTYSSMFAKPGVIGDSLAQGFYGATVQPKGQEWAYPNLVVKQAGSQLTYNKVMAPYVDLESLIREITQPSWQPCDVICRVLTGIGFNVGPKTSLPTHAGISGATYHSALVANGHCSDKTKTEPRQEQVWSWRWKKIGWFVSVPIYWYDMVTVYKCPVADATHKIGLGDYTQIEVMERIKPSFVFATVAGNHSLCTVMSVSTACLDFDGFKRSFDETMRRLKAIGTVKGGVLFTIPNVTSVAILDKYTDPQGRKDHTGLKHFYRDSVTNPSQVFDADETQVIGSFTEEMNREIREKGVAMGFAVANIDLIFADIKANGRQISGPNGTAPNLMRAHWPLVNQPGLFSLDGVHPNMLGHAVMANVMIDAINQQYNFSSPIPKVSEYSAWKFDSLNQQPIDTKGFLNNNIVGKAVKFAATMFMN